MLGLKPTTIRTRLLVSFVLMTLLPAIGISLGSGIVGYYNGRQQAIDRLESVATLKESALRNWVQSLQEELVIAANTDCAFERISVVLNLARDDKFYEFYNKAVRNRFRGLVGQSPQLQELFLVDLRGRVALSTDPAQEGRDYSDQDFFRKGLARPYTQLPFDGGEGRGRDSTSPAPGSVIAVIPVLGQQGRPLGVIGARADVQPLNEILDEGTGLGRTGKAYLVSSSYELLKRASLPAADVGSGEDEAPAIHSEGINGAVEDRSNSTGVYEDYRGVNVLGVYRYLPDLQAVLCTEQDLSEGFRAIYAIFGVNSSIALVAVLLAIGASLLLTRSIAGPLVNLVDTATQIAAGDLDRTAEVERDDELGALAQAFNSMTAQLRELINSLEQRVKERTRALRKANQALQRRAVQMETNAQVSKEVTSILDIGDLLTQVVDLIRDAFGYYHVHIFLLDRETDQLVLRASSSDPQPEHQSIPPGPGSINGRVVQTRAPIMVNDVTRNAHYLLDERLPDIRSELVIPLRLGDRVIGTLDVQSSEMDAFTDEDVLVIQSLGDQIAVAIENARLYERSQELAVLEERTRLARELHDSVTQSLYSVVLLTEGWRRSIRSGGTAHTMDYLERIGQVNEQALKEMRLLIHELRPSELEEEGLLGALHQRLEAVEKRVGISCRLLADELFELPHAVEEGLYRIAQEALNNALKHAHATRVVVRIKTRNGRTVLEVEDNGQGFDVGAIAFNSGMGLANMRHRADELGASIEIRSAPGQGTIVSVEVPADEQGGNTWNQ
jgi:nitrate/nitrite-specific signal transduction histidine kinase